MILYQRVFFGSECDNRCFACEARDLEKGQSLSDLVGQIDALTHPENLELRGGEPTLHSDLAACVSYARKRGARRIKLLTNGRRLGETDLLINLLEQGCRFFEVKVEGARPEVHDAVTGVRGSFEQTLRGLENVAGLASPGQYGGAPYVAARISVTRTNLKDVVSTTALLSSVGVDRIILARKGADVPMGESALFVANALRVATLNRVWSVCEGFPPCLMQGCERHVAECFQPASTVGEKPEGCLRCDFALICSGPPEAYVAQRGMREFRPVSGSPFLEHLERLQKTRSAHVQQ